MEYLIIFTISIIILLQIKQIMTQEELATGLAEVTATVGKIKSEVTTTLEKVTALEEALANAGTVSPEVQSAFDALKEQINTVDGLIPDAPTEPTE